MDADAKPRERRERRPSAISLSSAELSGQQPAAAGAPGDAGEQPGALYNADQAMDELVEKLKLLSYERDFCRRKKPYWTPLTRSYFTSPPPPGARYNSNEQFFYFTSLVAWLLHLGGRTGFKAPAQYDDPNASCNAIVIEMKDLGVGAVAAVQGKLRAGYGESVLQVLTIAADAAIKRRKVFFVRADCAAVNDEEEAEDGGAGAGNDDDDDDDLVIEEGGFIGGGAAGGLPGREDEEDYVVDGCIVETVQYDRGTEQDEDAKAIVEGSVDEHLWRAEVDRVVPKLRLTIAASATDWRAHVDGLGSLRKKLNKLYRLEDGLIRQNVVRLSEDIGNVVGELKAREESLNQGLERSLAEYRQQREKINSNQEQYKSVTDNVSELSNELATVTARLNEIKAIVDERGSNLSDSSPLVRIKAAIAKLNEELRGMDVRIGVAEHSMLSVNIKRRTDDNVQLYEQQNGKAAGDAGNPKRAMQTGRMN